jgi:hypothetical protein
MSVVTRAIRKRSASLSSIGTAQLLGHSVRSIVGTLLDADSEFLLVSSLVQSRSATLDGTTTLIAEAVRLTAQALSLDANGTVFAIGRRITRGRAIVVGNSDTSAHASHIATTHVDLEADSELLVGWQYIQYRGAALVAHSNVVLTINPLMNEAPIGGLLRTQGPEIVAVSRIASSDTLALLKNADESLVFETTRTDNEIGIRAFAVHGSDAPPFVSERTYDDTTVIVGHKTVPSLPITLIHTSQEL